MKPLNTRVPHVLAETVRRTIVVGNIELQTEVIADREEPFHNRDITNGPS